MASFDIVNKVDAQEVDNAINNTLKEINTRYDFRGLHTEVEFHKKENRIHLVAAESMKLEAVKDMLIKNFIKRGISAKVLDFKDPEGTSQGHLKMDVMLKEGIARETAKKIDDLQAVIKHLKSKDMGVPLQFVNMK